MRDPKVPHLPRSGYGRQSPPPPTIECGTLRGSRPRALATAGKARLRQRDPGRFSLTAGSTFSRSLTWRTPSGGLGDLDRPLVGGFGVDGAPQGDHAVPLGVDVDLVRLDQVVGCELHLHVGGDQRVDLLVGFGSLTSAGGSLALALDVSLAASALLLDVLLGRLGVLLDVLLGRPRRSCRCAPSVASARSSMRALALSGSISSLLSTVVDALDLGQLLGPRLLLGGGDLAVQLGHAVLHVHVDVPQLARFQARFDPVLQLCRRSSSAERGRGPEGQRGQSSTANRMFLPICVPP